MGLREDLQRGVKRWRLQRKRDNLKGTVHDEIWARMLRIGTESKGLDTVLEDTLEDIKKVEEELSWLDQED